MNIGRKAVGLGSALILAGASGWGAEGYKYSGYKWPDEDIPVAYRVYIGLTPPREVTVDDYVNAARGAYQKWEDVPTSYMSFTYKGETAAYPPNWDVPDGRNIVGWTNENLGTALGVNVYWAVGKDLIESDILLNRTMSWSAATPTPLSAFDLHSALLHEVGHALSLDDLENPAYMDQVMYGYIGSGQMKRELGEGDKAGITFIYPKKGDLSVSVVWGPASALEHETVELSATVRNSGPWTTSACGAEFYLSLDSRIDPGDTLLGRGAIPSLNKDEEQEARISLSLPAVAAERNYYVCAVADADEEVLEVSESNNTSCYFPLKVWLDSDGDGLPNGWEAAMSLDAYDATGDNGATGDPDGDGLGNRKEYEAGTDPRLADTDGDGQNDGDEVAAGTNPTDEGSLFRVAELSMEGAGSELSVRIGWPTVVGKKYQVYYADGLGSVWMPLGSLRTGNGGMLSESDADGLSQAMRVYRVRVQ